MLEFAMYYLAIGSIILYIVQHESSWTTPIYKPFELRYWVGLSGVVLLWPVLYIAFGFIFLTCCRSVVDFSYRVI